MDDQPVPDQGTPTPRARHARREATSRLGPDLVPVVLEPSPPSVVEEPWFADDPTVADAVPEGEVPVRPVSDQAAPHTWVGTVGDDPVAAAWAEDRWLGPWRRLEALDGSFVTTRQALQQVAVYAVSPARQAANGKIGLRYTHRGFGTPFFRRGSTDVQVRVEDGRLVVQSGEQVEVADLTTVAAAVELAGIGLDDGTSRPYEAPPLVDGPLDVVPGAAHALGDWFGFTCSVLEELRAEARSDAVEVGISEPSRVQLWPEHFDLAFDGGDPARSSRANYGGSPGDATSDEPYLYVGPWERAGLDEPFWNASFGATLSYQDLLAADDQRAAALAFFRAGRSRLADR